MATQLEQMMKVALWRPVVILASGKQSSHIVIKKKKNVILKRKKAGVLGIFFSFKQTNFADLVCLLFRMQLNYSWGSKFGQI